MIAFFTNPTQASHLMAIRETAALEKGMSTYSAKTALILARYNNYWLFSTTTFGELTLTYGYFGKIQTTNDVSRAVFSN